MDSGAEETGAAGEAWIALAITPLLFMMKTMV
jgi:hypothetical protein